MTSKSMVLILAVALACAGAIGEEKKASIPDPIKRVVFLGDSITYGGDYVCQVEAYFVTRYRNRQIEFINVGLPSETVSGLSEEGHAGGKFPRPDLHERLARVLKMTKPDLVFACYGMNDGIYQPLNDDRFGKYKKGMEWLRGEVLNAGAKLICITPPTYDGQRGGNATYNEVLKAYSEWLLNKRGAGWDVVDLHGPMDQFLAEHRRASAGFALAGDGVHPGELGHAFIARQILTHLGAKDLGNPDDSKSIINGQPLGDEILKLVQQRQGTMKDAWLTTIGHTRPEMSKGLPLEQANEKAAQIAEKLKLTR